MGSPDAYVENTIGRYKAIFGDRLRARSIEGQRVEAALAVRMLNRMLAYDPPNQSLSADERPEGSA